MLLCIQVPGFAVAVTRTREVWNAMLDALDALSPLVDDLAEGTTYLDMRGIDGAPGDWVRRAHGALADFGLPLRVGVAANKFVARAAASVCDGCICEPGGERALVAPLPLDLLGLDPPALERLHLFGVRTLGELAGLPHGPFVRRFGRAASLWHAHACGVDPEPVSPRARELQIDASLYGEGTAERAEQVYFALRLLVERVCCDLSRAGKAAALLQVTLECENGDVRELQVGLARATSDPRAMLDVLRAKIEGASFGAPISGLHLRAARLEEGGTPAALFACGEPDPQAVAVALARLEAVLGASGSRARVVPARRVEARFAYDVFLPPAPFAHDALAEPVAPSTVPQLRLLAVREIDVVLRGNAPSFVGSPSRAVIDCAGPWRIDEGWFDTPVARDEFDVLLEDGALYRIYRQGERWYVRGAYD
ncbi:MAG: DinB/UmuC family translesion DNA polymerase [Vulcanimicrobiaceae bacterium]